METTPQGDPIWTPEDQHLPAELVDQVVQVLRRVGLSLAHEHQDVGVFITRGDGLPLNTPEQADHVGLSWNPPHQLLDDMDQENDDTPGSAVQLLTALDEGMETVLTGVLTAAGLKVAPHPVTEILSVWPN